MAPSDGVVQFFEALGMAFGAIRTHKLRSFLTLLGIIFGVATVIVVVSLIEGFNKYVEEKIADLGSNAFVVNKMGMVTSLQEWIEKSKKNKDIKLDDLDAIRERRNYVRDAFDVSATLIARCDGGKSFFPLTRALLKDQEKWTETARSDSLTPSTPFA